MIFFPKYIFISTLFGLAWIGCNPSQSKNASEASDPMRCQLQNLGEAPDLILKGAIDDDRMATIQGITDPRSLVWRDKQDGETYYITRVMGSEQRLFYYRRIASNESPGIKTELTGHLIRWDKLPPSRFDAVAKALATKYDIHIDPIKTYLIDAEGKPTGCP
ncbi:MAG: hypothetical protein QNJ97_04965 [Myxococcota bacterium]|nr:hypothetical protein [Myxococcota bacterium]